ncbi:MAG: M20 family peptidase [Burkholderiaceae bacterium]
MKSIKRVLSVALLAVAAVVVVLIVNTVRFSPPPQVAGTNQLAPAPVEAVANKLAQAIQFETVSSRGRGTVQEQQPFRDFLAWLPTAFPAVHSTMNREIVGGLTPLYRWEGKDAALPPILLTAHYDVVPTEAQTLDQWEHPPFYGVQADGFIWGRGTLDNKGAVIALLETAERLIADGFQPARTVYMSFGHDEEIGGDEGAAAATEHLKANDIFAEWVLDEGSFVLDGVVSALDRPLATINVAEKGMLTLTLIANAPGGHSSMPPRETAVGTLAAAVSRLQQQPVPGGLSGLSETMFDGMARHFGVLNRMLFANRWLFGPIIESQLAAAATTDAVLRTTTAPTMLSGSNAENVLPTQASATVNFRLHPRDRVEDIVDHVRRAIDDERIAIEVSPTHAREASKVADHTAAGFRAIEKAALQSFGNIVVVPGLTIAGTDSRHYAEVARDAYRFNPFRVEKVDLPRLHGINERISVDNLQRAISFYTALLTDLPSTQAE